MVSNVPKKKQPRLVGWLGWLVGWLVGLVGWLVGWLVGLVGFLNVRKGNKKLLRFFFSHFIFKALCV